MSKDLICQYIAVDQSLTICKCTPSLLSSYYDALQHGKVWYYHKLSECITCMTIDGAINLQVCSELTEVCRNVFKPVCDPRNRDCYLLDVAKYFADVKLAPQSSRK